MTSNDPYNLQRFVVAQDSVFKGVCSELQAGHKQGHWMWFIFPQLKGLGHSQMAEEYGIASRAEAEAYLKHLTLGPRLLQCTQLVNAVSQRSIDSILGYPDNLKFRSSMTLFSLVSPDNPLFVQALEKYFGGQPDERTVQLLK